MYNIQYAQKMGINSQGNKQSGHGHHADWEIGSTQAENPAVRKPPVVVAGNDDKYKNFTRLPGTF